MKRTLLAVALAQDCEGVWHGRALRGNTEIQLLVDPDGTVSVNR